MARAKRSGQARGRLSLSVRLSLLVLFAALLPLAAVVGTNDFFARGTLLHQGRTALTTDLQAKVSLVDLYLTERFKDEAALASLQTTPLYLACLAAGQLPPAQAAALNQQYNCTDPQLGLPFYEGSNKRALGVGLVRDDSYMQWSLFSATGTMVLSCTQTHDPLHPCGPTKTALKVPKEDLAKVQQGQPFASAVYYDKAGKFAYISLYTPITVPGNPKQVLGFLQARLKLDYIWSIVNGEQNANGTGSYAFLTDENGVRIADSNASELFTAVRPLDAATQDLISSEQRFGDNTAVNVTNLPGVTQALQSTADGSSFQAPAAPQSSTQYQFVYQRIHVTNPFKAVNNAAPADITLPWTYFVLSPLSTVTQVADDQVRISLISAGVIAVLAILLGLLFGTRTARPVQEATGELQGAASALKRLASHQESSAGEQQWVVDAVKTGLDSVRYLSDAMNQAAHRIIDASNWFSEYWDRLTEEQALRTVQHLLELARYIDEAARRQQASSERLGKAITVTSQVSDQLVAGANAATRSAGQLEQVVSNLQHVVGGTANTDTGSPMDEVEQFDQMAAMGVSPAFPQVAGPSNRLDNGRAPLTSRPPQAPAAPEQWGRTSRAPHMQQNFEGNQWQQGNSRVFQDDNFEGDYADGWGSGGPANPAPSSPSWYPRNNR